MPREAGASLQRTGNFDRFVRPRAETVAKRTRWTPPQTRGARASPGGPRGRRRERYPDMKVTGMETECSVRGWQRRAHRPDSNQPGALVAAAPTDCAEKATAALPRGKDLHVTRLHTVSRVGG
jgi:hypothetical protein